VKPATEVVAMTRSDESPRVTLRIDYGVSPAFAEGVNALETAYLRVLLALLGLSGVSLLCLGYLILHTRALSDRVAREAAREATLDLADRTCHELGNGVFVLANERRNLAEHLDLVDRFIAEERPAREAAARRLGLEPGIESRWHHALQREYGARGIDPDLELRASTSVARQVCRQIGVCAEYIGITVHELDGFLKRTARPVELAPTRLTDCLDEAIALLRPRMVATGVTVIAEVEEGPALLASADRRLLIHALVNLLKNAIEAVAARIEAPRVEIQARGEGRSVAIEVHDNGPGLDPSARRRVFESGFSTKGPGRGRGLAIVRDSIHAQGGEITLVEPSNGGATFRITLARASPTTPTESTGDPGPS
jgi:signal transduction histidine kinase